MVSIINPIGIVPMWIVEGFGEVFPNWTEGASVLKDPNSSSGSSQKLPEPARYLISFSF